MKEITPQDISDLRNKDGEKRFKIIDIIHKRGYQNTLKDLGLPTDLNFVWRNLHTGSEETLYSLLHRWDGMYKKEVSHDENEELAYILEDWEPNIGPNPIKEAANKLTKEDVCQEVVRIFSQYKEWETLQGMGFEQIYHYVREGMQGGSFLHGGDYSIGGFLGNNRISTDKILVSWDSGKHYIFSLRQVLTDALSDFQQMVLF